MHNKSVRIPNISCAHCVHTIESEVSALENVLSVNADEKTKQVEISWNDPQNWENIKSLLNEINYPAVEE